MTVYFDKQRQRWRYDFELGGVRHAGPCPESRNAEEARQHEREVRSKLPRPATRRRNVTTRQGWVYFIATADKKHLKVGWTEKIPARLANLQIGNHQELVMVGKFRGSIEDERALHQYLAAFHVRGEWFIFSAEVAAAVSRRLEKANAEKALKQSGILVEVPPQSPPEENCPDGQIKLSA